MRVKLLKVVFTERKAAINSCIRAELLAGGPANFSVSTIGVCVFSEGGERGWMGKRNVDVGNELNERECLCACELVRELNER